MSIYETTIKNPKKIAEFYKQLSEQKDIEIKQLKKQLEASENSRKNTIFAIKNNCIMEDNKYTEICCDGEYLLNILDIDKGE